MKNEQIVNVLITHVDGLVDDIDLTKRLLTQFEDGPERSELAFLFRLARALQIVLRPLAAPADIAMFVIDNDAYDGIGVTQWVEKVEKRHVAWAIGGAVSVIVGTAGVILWRRNRSGGNVQTAV